VRQLDDGEICREMVRKYGSVFRIRGSRVTGNRERLEIVWEPLARCYHVLQKYLEQGNGLYITGEHGQFAA
jgi:hypothetical protein